MTFSGPQQSTRPLTPEEEMKLYCGLLEPEQAVVNMDYEQEMHLQKHGRSDDQEDRPAKHPKPEAGAGKGKGQPKGRWPAGSGDSQPESSIHLPADESAGAPDATTSGCRPLSTMPSPRRFYQHPESGYPTGVVLRELRGWPSQPVVASGEKVETQQGGQQSHHVLEGHHGDVYLGPDQAGSQGLSLEPQESIWFSQDRVWKYLTWNAQTKKHMVNTEVDPMSHDKVMEAIERLLELLPTGNVVHRLHSLRPLTETCEAPVVAFVLDIGLRAPEAQEAYVLVKSLCQLAVTQTASLNIRPDRLQRSALANHVQLQIAKLSSRSGWSIPPILVICMPSSPRGCGVAGPINLPCNRSVTRLERSRECFNSLLEARQPYTILDHPCWRTQFRAWQNPQVQHDIAEFAGFAASALFIDCMFYAWQSRIRIGLSCEVIEAGRACH